MVNQPGGEQDAVDSGSTTPGGPLARFKVLDLSGEQGQLCGRMLAGLGADVIKVEPPEGDPVRRLGPWFHDEESLETSLRWFALNVGKRSLAIDLDNEDGRDKFRGLVRQSDVVIESFPVGRLEELGLGYLQLKLLNPRLVLTSVSGYGQSGPYKDAPWSDITAIAMGGLMFLSGDEDRPPLRMSSNQSFFHVSMQATIGTLLAIYGVEGDGEGQWVDASAQESVTMTLEGPGPLMNVWRMMGRNMGRLGFLREPAPGFRFPTVLPCKDGHIAVATVLGQALPAWVAALDEDGMADDLGEERWSSASFIGTVQPGQWVPTGADIDHVYGIVSKWALTHTRAEIADAASRHHFLAGPQNTLADILHSEQLLARGFFAEVDYPELRASITYPGAPFRMSDTPWQVGSRAPRLGEHTDEILSGLQSTACEARPSATDTILGHPQPRVRMDLPAATTDILSGVKVADFSWIGVGPVTSLWLAWHGATTVRVESTRRLDGVRFLQPFKDGVSGVNRSAYFACFNVNKLGMTCNLNTEKGREVARRLIEWSDVVVENFTPKAMPKWGLDYSSIVRFKPDIIMLSASLQGQDGPDAMSPGFGNMLQGMAGLNEQIGWPDRGPSSIATTYTDWIVPYFGASALISALIHKRRTGRGQYIDLSQYEAAIHCLGPSILDYTVNGRLDRPIGNDLVAGDHRYAAPHGAYPCRSTDGQERFITLAIFDDEQWCRLVELIDSQEARDACYSTQAGRCEHAKEVDRLVERWTSSVDADSLLHSLWAKGIPAGIVKTEADLANDVQILHRQHFAAVPHTEIGDLTVDMPGFRIGGKSARPCKAGPCLGEDNEQVYQEILGYSEAEYYEMLAEGVIEMWEH